MNKPKFYKHLKTKYGSGKNAVGRIRKNVIAYSVYKLFPAFLWIDRKEVFVGGRFN